MRVFKDTEIAEINDLLANGSNVSFIAKTFNTSVRNIKELIESVRLNSPTPQVCQIIDDLKSQNDQLETNTKILKTEIDSLRAENKTLLERISVLENSHGMVVKEPVPCEKKQVISPLPQKTLEEAMAEKPNDPFFKLMIESKRKAAQKEARRVAAELREESEEYQFKMLIAKQLRT